MAQMPEAPGHHIMVTRGPFGRAWFDCPPCGIERKYPSLSAANYAAIVHHHEALGRCACPPEVRDIKAHPQVGAA